MFKNILDYHAERFIQEESNFFIFLICLYQANLTSVGALKI